MGDTLDLVKAYLGSMYKDGDEQIVPIRIAAEEYAKKDKKGKGFFGFFSKKEHPFDVEPIPIVRNGRQVFYTSNTNPLSPKIPVSDSDRARIFELLGAYQLKNMKGGKVRTRKVKNLRRKTRSKWRKN
jgi:hypothetical protein